MPFNELSRWTTLDSAISFLLRKHKIFCLKCLREKRQRENVISTIVTFITEVLF